jgi:hypothetical protein
VTFELKKWCTDVYFSKSIFHISASIRNTGSGIRSDAVRGDTFLEEPLFLLAVVQGNEEQDEEGSSADQQRSANSLSKHQDQDNI